MLPLLLPLLLLLPSLLLLQSLLLLLLSPVAVVVGILAVLLRVTAFMSVAISITISVCPGPGDFTYYSSIPDRGILALSLARRARRSSKGLCT